MKHSLYTFLALAGFPVLASAQMVFTFPPTAGVMTEQLTTGATLVEFPLGTDLSTVMQQAEVTIDGRQVEVSELSPRPDTLTVADGQQVVFTYGGKAYAFQFSNGQYFTAVFTSDPHVSQNGHDETTVTEMRGYVKQIAAMGKAGGPRLAFTSLPGYLPHCDIAFSLGDMDADSRHDDNDFAVAHAGFHQAGIPFITMAGNHDCVPDYWTGANGDPGLTFGFNDGGSYANDIARATVEHYCDTAQTHGVESLETITDGSSHTHFAPFTFTFKGIRFYCGQTYWFQKPYDKPTLFAAAKYYAPDGDINALETFAKKHANEPSVWMQHYPFVAGSDCDRWWLDQNDVGRYIKTEDASEYGTHDDVPLYTNAAAKAVAKKKKDKLAAIIMQTRNAVHFSGHTHSFALNNYNTLKDYTVAAPGRDKGAAYIVLLKQGVGVVEVRLAHFNSAVSTGTDSVTTVEIAAQATNAEGALHTRLASALKDLGAPHEGSVDDLNAGFASWFKANAYGGQADVTALLGANTDFEATQGNALASLPQVHYQPGWNVHVASFTNTTNAQYIHLRQRTDDGASSKTSLYIRAKWQDQMATDQVVKQTALPAGTYKLSFSIKRAGTLNKNLCYYEVGGKRNLVTASTAWGKKSFTLQVNKPSLLTLSFGFQGGAGSTESSVSIDNIQLVCTAAGATVNPPTGIGTSQITNQTSNDTRYDLSGRRVQRSYKGLVIRKGKKALMPAAR